MKRQKNRHLQQYNNLHLRRGFTTCPFFAFTVARRVFRPFKIKLLDIASLCVFIGGEDGEHFCDLRSLSLSE